VEDEIMERRDSLIAALEKGLRQIAQNNPQITEVRGQGMMWGLVSTFPAAQAVKTAQAQGLLILSAGSNVIRLLPPLIISEEEIALLLEKLQVTLRIANDE
jgi:acetylornithine/succinyldiaminopimelate/putrescine aminotransferase